MPADAHRVSVAPPLTDRRGLGGYLPIELPAPDRWEPPPGALLVNSARNALRLVIRAAGAHTVHLPELCCGVLAEAARSEGAAISWYPLGRDLMPVQLPIQAKGELVLLTDFYGVLRGRLEPLLEAHAGTVLDATHAHFGPWSSHGSTISSPRKMLGLADGGVLLTELPAVSPTQRDSSTERYLGRLGRLDKGPERARSAHQRAEDALEGAPVMEMSPLTERLLRSCDPDEVTRRRQANFDRLESVLAEAGLTRFGERPSSAPFAWPLVADRPGLHAELHRRRVYAPVLWPEVLDRCAPASAAAWAARHIVPLPVDQNLSEQDIEEVAERVLDAVRA